MSTNNICPVERAGALDNKIRRWFQNPKKILKPYVKDGMSVLDIGCGPGFFTVDMAQMVGPSGMVVASDLQDGMLKKLEKKINGTDIKSRITLHQSGTDTIGIKDQFDFILAFYLVHEVPDQVSLFSEINALLKPDGAVFIAEPIFHVSKKAFKQTIKIANEAGFTVYDEPNIIFSKAVVLKKNNPLS